MATIQRNTLLSTDAILNVAASSEGTSFVSCRPPSGCSDMVGSCRKVYEQAAGVLARSGLQVVHERLFADIDRLAELHAVRGEVLALHGLAGEGPLTCIQGNGGGGGLGGLQLRAVPASCQVEPLELNGVIVGRCWRQGGALWLMLQNMHGRSSLRGDDNSRVAQVERMIRQVQQILEERGGSYGNVIRTWIYIDDILDWYGPFNAARNAQYARLGIMPNGSLKPLRLPASTGIGGHNPQGAACLMDVLAVIPQTASPLEIRRMTNTRQKEAFRYGSAFARGAVVASRQCREIYISGTAAIDDHGKSLHIGDAAKQLETTLDIVEGLLSQEGAALADIAEATFFFKHQRDIPLLAPALARRGLSTMPGACVTADICRDELLFELDCMALH